MPNTSFAVTVSIFFHLALGTLVLLNVDFSALAPPEELQLNQPIIEATIVDEKVIREQINKIKDQKTALRKQEEKRVKDKETQKKRRLLEKKKAQQAVVAAREKKKKQQEKAKKLQLEKVEKERQRKKAEVKAKLEKEQKALKAAERKRQDALEKDLQENLLAEQLQAEQATRQRRRGKQVLSEVQKYQVLITQAIQRNWITDDSMRGKFCRLNIRLAPDGLVIQVKEIAGDAIVCRSAKAAVAKSDTLPVSREADVYQKLKDINLTVRPEL
jgi:colicin import membrane protein